MRRSRSTTITVLSLNIVTIAIILYKFEANFSINNRETTLYSFILFFSVFYFAASVTFLRLWKNHLNIIKEIPISFKKNYSGDNTMLLCALTILLWQIENLIYFFNCEIKFFLTSRAIILLINSGLWLKIVSQFQITHPPIWKRNRYLNSVFMSTKGILIIIITGTLLSIISSFYYNELELFSDPKKNLLLILIPATIVSFIMSIFLFGSLYKVFKEQNMDTLIFLIIVNCVLMAWDLTNKFLFDNFTSVNTLDFCIHTGNTMTMMALSFALVIVHHTHIRKLYLNEKNNELNEKNNELNEKNIQLEILKLEVSHRVKNHLKIILLGIESQVRKNITDGNLSVIPELQAVRARTNAILTLHELLHTDSDESNSPNIILLNYLKNLLIRLKQSFDYKPIECFDYQIEISNSIKAKASIAPQIGMLITEICLNVDQHAYLATQSKKIKILINKSQEDLVIVIRDKGQGIESGKPIGSGLKIVDAITKQIGGRFLFQPDNPGMRAEIYLSIKNLA